MIIDFFETLIEKWNNEQKCGFCWEFSAPLSESGMNKHQSENPCCVHAFITDYATQSGYTKDRLTNLANREWCDHNFVLYVVMQSNLGINVYNEISNHSIDAGLWKSILKPIQNCLGCGNELELCEMGYNFEITKWTMQTVLLKEDENYTGWKISGTFRQYHQ